MFKLFCSTALITALAINAQDINTEVLENYFTNVPSAWKGHREFAEWIVKDLQAEEIVDLGVDYGYSTFCFAKAAHENGFGRVTGIDSFEGDGFAGVRDTYELVSNWINDFGFLNINILKGYFNEVAAAWTAPIDILHIDGFHSYQAVHDDYHSWSCFVKESGVILFHDICVNHPDFGVIYFFRELEDGFKLYFIESYGLGIITKNESLAERIKARFPHVHDYSKEPL